MITPNIPEAIKLGKYNDAQKNAMNLQEYCHVYLKGGHSENNKGVDTLYLKGGSAIPLFTDTTNVKQKHGSGCVLSSAITAYLAKGLELEDACKQAKLYTFNFLMSNESTLGYHSNLVSIEHE